MSPDYKDKLSFARALHQKRSVRWGFVWAMWCAVMWGAWYLPGAALFTAPPFSILNLDDKTEYIVAISVISGLNAVSVLFFLLLWVILLGKLGELYRTTRQFSNISKWFILAAVIGGPCAHTGTYLAIGFVGPVFAAVSSVLYPIVGATVARLWYNEKISFRAAIGILVIVIGGVIIFLPGITNETAATNDLVLLGYIGGILSMLGWGIEGAIAGRGLDIADPDVGITIRFAAEVFYWIFIILPAVIIFVDAPVVEIIKTTFNFEAILWLSLAGLCYGFCYVSWYKSFPLIGVGRGQAVGSFYAVFAVIFISVFSLKLPEWNFLIGVVFAVIGTFLMITEPTDMVEVIREPSKKMDASGKKKIPANTVRLHMKGFVLRLFSQSNDATFWDYEIAEKIRDEYGYHGVFWDGEIRVMLVDLYSGALIEKAADKLDDGSHFGAGKLLVQYRLTNFGQARLNEANLT